MNLVFDEKATKNESIKTLVEGFLKDIPTSVAMVNHRGHRDTERHEISRRE
jgi:hypothetical protein